jgi:UDP:flavonoid glycosyltransferase YjiC (YdhE family)
MLPLKGLSADQLTAALRELLYNPAFVAAAQRIAAGLQQEDGLEVALKSLQGTLCAAV